MGPNELDKAIHVHCDSTIRVMQDQETPFVRTVTLFERAVFLTTAVSFVMAFLYVAGSYQEFAARTQRQLLFVLQAIAGIGSAGALLSIVVEGFIVVARRRPRRLARVVALLFVGVLMAAAVVASSSVLVFLEGTE